MKNILVIILNNNGKGIQHIVTQLVEHVNFGLQIVLIVLPTVFIFVAIYSSYAKKSNYVFFRSFSGHRRFFNLKYLELSYQRVTIV